MITQPRLLLNLSLRLLLSWLVLSIGVLFYANEIMRFFLPMISWVIDQTSSLYTPHLKIIDVEGKSMIGMLGITRELIPISPSYTIPVGSKMRAATNVIHTLVPMVIIYTVIIAAPMPNIRARLLSLSTGSLFMVLVLLLSAPFLLAGHIEILYMNVSSQYGIAREPGWIYDWMVFAETGGRWIFPLIGAALALLITRLVVERVSWFNSNSTKSAESQAPSNDRTQEASS